MEFIEPTKRGKATIVAFYIAIFGWYFATRHFLVPITKYVQKLPACESIPWVKGEIIYFSIAAFFVTALCLWQAAQIFKHRQLPLPGTHVFKRTAVRRGWPVMVSGAGFLFSGVVIIAGSIYLFFMLDVAVLFSATEGCACA